MLAITPRHATLAAPQSLSLDGVGRGSGKSTTLNLIAGFDYPSRGAIRIDGEDVTWLPSHRRGIGMVFQNYALFPHLSVFENVAFPLRSRGWRGQDIEHGVREALGMVQLG